MATRRRYSPPRYSRPTVPAYRPPVGPSLPSSKKSEDDTTKFAVAAVAVAILAWFLWPKKAKAVEVTTPPASDPVHVIPVQPPPPVTYDTYTIKKGESLSQIASNFYGDGKKPRLTTGDQNWRWWPLIYDLNQDVIKNPSLIYVNATIKIPKKADLPMDKKDEYFARSMKF